MGASGSHACQLLALCLPRKPRAALERDFQNMANYAVWNVRKRHEWLQKQIKGKYLSRRKRARVGLQEALDRKSGEGAEQSSDAES